MSDNISKNTAGELLEFRYNSLVFARVRYEVELNSLMNRIAEALSKYHYAKEAEEEAKLDMDLYYSKLN